MAAVECEKKGEMSGSRKFYIISRDPSPLKFCKSQHPKHAPRKHQSILSVTQFIMPSSSEINDAQDMGSFSLPIGGTDAPVLILRDDLHSPKSHLPVSAIDHVAA